METKTKTINQKLLDFQTSIEVIKKDGKNPHFKNTYATLQNILSEVKPMLNAIKLILTQPIEGGEVITLITCTETGESIKSSISLTPGLNAQQKGSEITYYRRYTLASLLALDIDDDDANLASKTAPIKQVQPTAPAPEKLWLNKFADKSQTDLTDTWKNVIAAIESGEFKTANVEKKYKLSKELKDELLILEQKSV